MDNPFMKVAESDPEAAKVLAHAVMSAWEESEVFACLRMARRLLGRSFVSHLGGSAFSDWVVDGDIERMSALTEMAADYLESLFDAMLEAKDA